MIITLGQPHSCGAKIPISHNLPVNFQQYPLTEGKRCSADDMLLVIHDIQTGASQTCLTQSTRPRLKTLVGFPDRSTSKY